MIAAPPPHVIAAFGGSGDPEPLVGGITGTVWRAGDVVLKQLDLSLAELSWQAEVLTSIGSGHVRVAPPLRGHGGQLTVGGWRAYRYLEGRHERRRWPDIIAAGEALHTALAHVPRPAFLEERSHGWAMGDRVAWGEVSTAEARERWPITQPLLEALRPVEARSQVIHGDLSGNVLFDPGLPPGIIDFSPYWRPRAFAVAIVVADALVAEGADESLLEATTQVDDFGQYLVRALIFRLVSDLHLPTRPGLWRRYEPAVKLALRLAG